MGLLFNPAEALANPSRDYWENEGRYREGNPMQPRIVKGIPFNDDFMDTDGEGSGNLSVLRKQWEQRKLNEFKNMTPYAQSAMQGNPYGNSDSYYDAPTGVASIGYGKPKRRLVAIRNGQEIYEGDFNAPFETASITNDRNAKRASEFNAIGNQDYMDQQEDLRSQQPNPAAVVAQSLMQRYKQNKAPSYSRIGNEFNVNGQLVSSNLDQDAAAAGMDADSFIQSKFNAAKQKAAQEAMARMSGDFQIGNNAMFNDEQFLGLDPQMQAKVFKDSQGYDLNDEITANRMGGNMTLAGLRNQQAIPERQQEAFKYFGGIKQATGENAFALMSAEQDPNTGEFLVPGDMIEDETGRKVQGPPKRYPASMAAIIRRMKQYQAPMAGFADDESMNMSDPAYRQQQEDDAIIAAREEYLSRNSPPHDQFMESWQRGQQQQPIPQGVMTPRQRRIDSNAAEAATFAAKRRKEMDAMRAMQQYQAAPAYDNPMNHGMF